MAGKPAEPSPSPDVGRSGQEGGHEQRELVGPLVVARHVKGDGRVLLLYTCVPRERT